MIPLIAIVPLIYNGRRILKGRRFSVLSLADARVLKVLGRAKDAPAVPATPPPEPDEPIVKRTYRRRDLVAEDPA